MSKQGKIWLIIGCILVGLLLIMGVAWSAFSGWRGNDGWGMMWPGMMGGYGLLWLMPLGMIVFWGLVIWGIVALIRFFSSSGGGSMQHSNSAMEILKNRYAKGEISKEEFEEKKKDLL